MYPLWEALNNAKKYRWVELSHSMNNDSPYWAGIPEGNIELAQTCFDWGNPMLECQVQTFKFPGQFGTLIRNGRGWKRKLPRLALLPECGPLQSRYDRIEKYFIEIPA